MKTEIINIGNELLIGQVVNTNASWMAEEMNRAGFEIAQITVISDDSEAILSSLKDAEARSSVILVTGGLGPTRDDITKETICNYFQTRLVFNEIAFKSIENLFAGRGFKITELNRQQAEVPETCIPLQNKNGTAPGLWFERPGKGDFPKTIFVFMPGVPFEMKAMVTDEVIPRLKEIFKAPSIVHKTILTQGVGESFLAEKIEDWEINLPKNISLAYLPQPGIVRLRLSGTGESEEIVRTQINHEIEQLLKLIPRYIYGFDDDKLEEIIGQLLFTRNQTLATAESCTGGTIAQMITSIPGSSRYFKGSVVAYANEVKESELAVKTETLLKYGAVCKEVVIEMATGIREKFHCDYSIATSGIAGPGGGSDEKPVGTTWIAIATPEKVVAYHYLFGDHRERNIRKTALQALNLLRKVIQGFE